jgi:hypothetical protein
MVNRVLRRAANLFGFDIFSRTIEWRWSHTAESYYPVSPKPRWGHGNPLLPQIERLLSEQRGEFVSLLTQMQAAKAILATVPKETTDLTKPYWGNSSFSSLDAASLVGMLVVKKPAIYLEIGSGNSTKFARLAISSALLETQIVSIDPFPRAEIDGLCDRLIRTQLEDCDQSIFDQIRSGDIVFFDGSHRVFTNSDVTIFFLEILPRLPKGTIVHIHDIFLPADYPADWNARMYSEQYILAAMMLGRAMPFKVLLPNYYACIDPQISSHVTSLVEPHMHSNFGGSFWLQMI